MTYQDRLARYEAEKKKLLNSNLTAFEYEKAIIALAKKWKI